MIRKKNIQEVDLGDVEFAPDRSDVSEEEGREKNTLIEDFIYRSIYEWINLEKQPDASVVAALRDAMNHGIYSRFFVGPQPNLTVYRGLSVDGNTLSRWLGYADLGAVKEGWGDVDGSWIFRPKDVNESFTSYTLDPETASVFSGRGGKEYKVVVEALAGENRGSFLDIYAMTRRIDDSDHFDEDMIEFEREVIGIGPIKVRKIWWMTRGADVPNLR